MTQRLPTSWRCMTHTRIHSTRSLPSHCAPRRLCRTVLTHYHRERCREREVVLIIIHESKQEVGLAVRAIFNCIRCSVVTSAAVPLWLFVLFPLCSPIPSLLTVPSVCTGLSTSTILSTHFPRRCPRVPLRAFHPSTGIQEPSTHSVSRTQTENETETMTTKRCRLAKPSNPGKGRGTRRKRKGTKAPYPQSLAYRWISLNSQNNQIVSIAHVQSTLFCSLLTQAAQSRV